MKRGRMFRGLAALLLGVWIGTACGVDTPTAPAPQGPDAHLVGDVLGTVGRLAGTLLTCRPQEAASDAEWVGPAGGVLNIGPHRLVVPPGALSRPVRIRGEVVTDSVNSVRLYPHGLEFDRPVWLTLSYANCPLVPSLLPKRVAYTSEGLRILEWLPSLDNPLQKKVTGRLDHFSRYAVGW